MWQLFRTKWKAIPEKNVLLRDYLCTCVCIYIMISFYFFVFIFLFPLLPTHCHSSPPSPDQTGVFLFLLRIMVLFPLYVVNGFCLYASMTMKESSSHSLLLWLLNPFLVFSTSHLVAHAHLACTLFLLFIHYVDWSMAIVLLLIFRGRDITGHSPKADESMWSDRETDLQMSLEGWGID